jgi:hypothetical protein
MRARYKADRHGIKYNQRIIEIVLRSNPQSQRDDAVKALTSSSCLWDIVCRSRVPAPMPQQGHAVPPAVIADGDTQETSTIVCTSASVRATSLLRSLPFRSSRPVRRQEVIPRCHQLGSRTGAGPCDPPSGHRRRLSSVQRARAAPALAWRGSSGVVRNKPT